MPRNDREPNKYDNNLPPAVYLLGAVFMLFKRSKKGTVYASVKFRVIAGIGKGAEFWSPLFLESSNGLQSGLSLHLRACENNEYIDPNDHALIAEKVLWKPFKAIVSRDFYRNKPQNKIKKYLFKESGDVTSIEIEMMNKWAHKNRDMRPKYKDNTAPSTEENNSYYAAPPPEDEDFYSW
jgi:hypothetical protein